MYVGPGIIVHYKAARRHALEDQQAGALIESPTPPPLDPPTFPDDTGDSDVEDLFQEELFALEAEIAGRTTWSPTGRPLVFLKNPGPTQWFTFPIPSDIHLSNHGPHALDPACDANVAYIENEMRLCEILVQLRGLRHSGTPLPDLEEKVSEGLARMWRHKEVEWRRRRYRSVAILHGFPVVDTGTYSFSIWATQI
jgi:hypothetical protein